MLKHAVSHAAGISTLIALLQSYCSPAAAGGLRSQVPDLVHGPRELLDDDCRQLQLSRLVDENGLASSTGGRRRASTWQLQLSHWACRVTYLLRRCPADDQRRIKGRLRGSGGRIRLVSVSVRKTSQGARPPGRVSYGVRVPFGAATDATRETRRYVAFQRVLPPGTGYSGDFPSTPPRRPGPAPRAPRAQFTIKIVLRTYLCLAQVLLICTRTRTACGCAHAFLEIVLLVVALLY